MLKKAPVRGEETQKGIKVLSHTQTPFLGLKMQKSIAKTKKPVNS